MSQNPWSQPPEPAPAPRRSSRVWMAAAIGLVIAIALAAAAKLSAGRELTSEDWAYLAMRVMMLVLVLSALLGQALSRGKAIKHLLAWFGIGALLFLGFTFRDELGFVGARLGAEFSPGAAMQTRPGEMLVTRDVDGAFYVLGEVNGTTVRFLVDTGASDVVLSPTDARRIGVDPESLDYARSYQTANGEGRGAVIRVDSLSVGAVQRQDMPVSVNRAPMDSSLLGMSFFRHLESVEMRGDKLYLRWAS